MFGQESGSHPSPLSSSIHIYIYICMYLLIYPCLPGASLFHHDLGVLAKTLTSVISGVPGDGSCVPVNSVLLAPM